MMALHLQRVGAGAPIWRCDDCYNPEVEELLVGPLPDQTCEECSAVIRITVEMLPGGDESRARVIDRATITNQVTATLFSAGTHGDYEMKIFKRVKPGEVWKSGRIENFPRKRLGVWDMLYRLLHRMVGKRNERGLEDGGEHGDDH